MNIRGFFNGESGIRTHGDISATLDFESSALDQLSHLSNCGCGAILPVLWLCVKIFSASCHKRGYNF